jgi:hypothetical protein
MQIIHVFRSNSIHDHTDSVLCYCEPEIAVSEGYTTVTHETKEPGVFPEWEFTVLGDTKQTT